METYCACCKKILQMKILVLEKTKQNRLMALSHFVVCGKKSIFVKNQKAKRLELH